MRPFALAALFLLCQPVAASPLSCDRFKEKLAAAIHAGGDRVAQPWGWTKSKADDFRQEFRGIVGLYGDVTCLAGNFSAFGATAEINSSESEDRFRQERLVAIGAAAVCAVEALPPSSCLKMTQRMADEAIRELAASVRRGDEASGGVGLQDLMRSGADVQIDAAKGTLTVSLNVSPKDSVEDLSPQK